MAEQVGVVAWPVAADPGAAVEGVVGTAEAENPAAGLVVALEMTDD